MQKREGEEKRNRRIATTEFGEIYVRRTTGRFLTSDEKPTAKISKSILVNLTSRDKLRFLLFPWVKSIFVRPFSKSNSA